MLLPYFTTEQFTPFFCKSVISIDSKYSNNNVYYYNNKIIAMFFANLIKLTILQ